jgi:energy-coupling factor transporter ATP-binding protein EcfA2
MRIYAIELENFRMFENKRVEFPAMFSVLIGENGSGKTTVLEAVAVFLQLGLLHSLQGKLGSGSKLGDPNKPSLAMNRYFLDEFDNKVQAPTAKIGAEYQLPGHPKEAVDCFFRLSGSGRDITFIWRPLIDGVAPQSGVTALQSFGEKVAKMLLERGNPTLPVVEYFDTSARSRRMDGDIAPSTNGNRLEHGYLGALQGGNTSREFFFSWFHTFEFDARAENAPAYVREHLDCVKSAITSVIPEWRNIGFNLANNDLVGTIVTNDGQEKRTFFRELSDGYRSVIILAATIAWRCIRLNPHLGKNAAQESPGIVLIDEIDQHLHPNWQKRIVGDLKRTFPKIQFICTTHSPFIVQSLEPNEIWNLDGLIAYNPKKDLSLEDVAEGIMGVKGSFSNANEAMEAQSRAYFTILEEKGSVDELDVIESQISDPAVRAFLVMQRLKQQLPK